MNLAVRPVLLALLVLASPAAVAERPLELGVRMLALHADGDMYGAGAVLRLRLADGWFIGATLDEYSHRLEHAPLPAARATRSELQKIVFGVSIGRERAARAAGLHWFWTMGLAAGFPTTVLQQGANPQLDVIAATEVHLTSALGASRALSERWSLSGALRLERHYVDLRFQQAGDHGAGRITTLSPAGLYVALSYRF